MHKFLALIFVSFLFACKPGGDDTVYRLVQGETMGTYYRVTYEGAKNHQYNLDSLLVAINDELSTYIPESAISRFNRMATSDSLVLTYADQDSIDWHFHRNMEKAKEVYENSEGAFNPCVMPLVNYWGFGYTEKRPVTSVDSVKVDSLMKLVRFNDIVWGRNADSFFMKKVKKGIELDLSAIAKGYAVDRLAEWLEDQGCGNYLVDIGGEARGKGVNARGIIWTTGINTPKEGASEKDIMAVLELSNVAVATSGNYRNFYEVDGQKFSHTINPWTGFPERSQLLSVSVIADDCTTADAYATACMVKGLSDAKEMVEEIEGVEAYFIFSDDTGNLQAAQSTGFSQYLKSN